MTNPETVFSEAVAGVDREQAEREQLLQQVRLAFNEMARAYDDVIGAAEQALEGAAFAGRARSIADEALEQVAEVFGTRPLSQVDTDDFVQQSEHLLHGFSGTSEDLEEAKRILGDAFDELIEVKEELQRAA